MKTAIVTGGSRGIGRAIALELSAAGHRVVVSYRQDDARAEETVGEIRAKGGEAAAIAADVTKREEVRTLGDRVAAEVGGGRILVHNGRVVQNARFPFH